MVRGFTDAAAGQAVLAGVGSDRVLELRVAEGRHVKRGEVIAVLANYPLADIAVRSAEAGLEKAKARRRSLASGILVAKEANKSPAAGETGKTKSKDSGPAKPGIAEQEILVKLSAEENKLKMLNLQRSSLPEEQKKLEISISEWNLEHERARLRVLKETLASELAENDTDIRLWAAELENARLRREQALVRSPFDGIVVQIWARPGERIERGIAEIVDMSRLRVVADVDEVLFHRIKVGGEVKVVFRGERTSHAGKVVRIGSEVRRTANLGSAFGGTANVRAVPVEIELNDPSQMPQMLGREAIVTFEEQS